MSCQAFAVITVVPCSLEVTRTSHSSTTTLVWQALVPLPPQDANRTPTSSRQARKFPADFPTPFMTFEVCSATLQQLAGWLNGSLQKQSSCCISSKQTETIKNCRRILHLSSMIEIKNKLAWWSYSRATAKVFTLLFER